MAITTPLSDSYLREINRAPKEAWESLAKTAEDRSWTVNELRAAIQEIKDETTPPERKQALLQGDTEPIAKKDGKPAFLQETVQREIAKGLEEDKAVALTSAWDALSTLEQFAPKEVVDEVDAFIRERIIKDGSADREYLQELEKYARERLKFWKRVKG